MLQAFLEIDATEAAVAGGEGWLPTVENVKALPEGNPSLRARTRNAL